MGETAPRPLSARELFAALVAAGIFREGDRFSRVTIELDARTNLVTIETESYADPRLLEAVPQMTRALVSAGGPRQRKRREIQ